MKKQSSYQKLKLKIFNLENDIRTIVMNEESWKALELKAKYAFKYESEDSVLYGESPIVKAYETRNCIGIFLNILDKK